MKKVIEWIRSFWEQRKAPEPSPHPDTGKNELARVRALLCIGLAACGTAGTRSADAARDAGVVDAAPLELPQASEPAATGEAQLGRPLTMPQLPDLGPSPLVAPFAVGPDLPTSVRRF